MTWKIDLLIISSLLIVSSCVPNSETNKKQKQVAAVTNESTGMVSTQSSNKDSGKDKDDKDKDDDSNHNSKDTTPPSLPGFATFNKFYNASNFPIQFTWGVSVDANLSGYNYKICGSSDCRSTCKTQQSSLGTIPSGTIIFDGVAEGMNYACVQAFDKSKNTTSFTNVGSFTVDTIAPVASKLSLESSGIRKDFSKYNTISWIAGSVVGASQMCFTSTLSSTTCNWIDIGITGNYTLPNGIDGLRTVYLYYKDEALNISKPISATINLDTKAPTNVALSVTNPTANIIGGVDSNFNHFVIRFCDSPECTNILSSMQSKTTLINLADMIALNKSFYTAVYAIDLAENMSNVTIVAYTYVAPTTPTTPTTPDPEQPTTPVINSPIKDIAMGGTSMCVAFAGGVVKCAGENGNGQFGYVNDYYYSGLNQLKNAYAHNLGADFEIAQLKKGIGSFFCALSTTGAVKCWGWNLNGSLGQGVGNDLNYIRPPFGPSNVNIGPDKAAQLSAGGYHVCIVTVKGEIKCWGENEQSQLGLGHQNNIGDGPSEMGPDLKAVNLGTNLKALKVAAGWRYTCALLSNYKVKCWGFDFHGTLGDDGSHIQENDNTFHIGARASDMGDNLQPVYLGEDAIDIYASSTHVCAILKSKKVKCWGQNYHAQLGLTDNDDRGHYSSTNSMHDLPTLNFGNNKVSKLSVDSRSTCAILDNGETICWGRNDSATLGNGLRAEFTTLANSSYINFGTGLKADRIFQGECFSCAVLTNGKVKCWGNSGNVIKGTMGYISDSLSEMGDNLPYVDLGI